MKQIEMNRKLIIEKFNEVKKIGYVKSHRENNTGIGKTFEDFMGVEENNIQGPDLLGYEIKSHREGSNSWVTLFTKVPSSEYSNSYLRDEYGKFDNGLRKLYSSIYGHKINRGFFKLIVDECSEKVYVAHTDTKGFWDNKVFYTFDDIREILNGKLNKLFYASAKVNKLGGVEYFKYDKADIYTEPTLNNFIRSINDGIIRYDIRMGSYKSGEKVGQPHDHGSGFRIRWSSLIKLYNKHENIE